MSGKHNDPDTDDPCTDGRKSRTPDDMTLPEIEARVQTAEFRAAQVELDAARKRGVKLTMEDAAAALGIPFWYLAMAMGRDLVRRGKAAGFAIMDGPGEKAN
jgi:hypothetical protein